MLSSFFFFFWKNINFAPACFDILYGDSLSLFLVISICKPLWVLAPISDFRIRFFAHQKSKCLMVVLCRFCATNIVDFKGFSNVLYWCAFINLKIYFLNISFEKFYSQLWYIQYIVPKKTTENQYLNVATFVRQGKTKMFFVKMEIPLDSTPSMSSLSPQLYCHLKCV